MDTDFSLPPGQDGQALRAQAERWLACADPELRLRWARRLDWGAPTPEQVARGLRDVDSSVVCAWVERLDWGPPFPEQVERGLQDMKHGSI